jgi:hypothetical protein
MTLRANVDARHGHWQARTAAGSLPALVLLAKGSDASAFRARRVDFVLAKTYLSLGSC